MICAWHVALNLRQKCDHRVTCGKHLSSLQNWVLPVTLDEVVIRLAKEQQLIHSELSIRKVRQIFCYIPDYSWQDLVMSSNVIFYKNDKNETRLWNGLPPGWCKLKLCASKGTVCIWKHYIVPCWVFQKKKKCEHFLFSFILFFLSSTYSQYCETVLWEWLKWAELLSLFVLTRALFHLQTGKTHPLLWLNFSDLRIYRLSRYV